MVIEIGVYTVSTLDDYNFTLTKKRPKRPKAGQSEDEVSGETEVHIGYYGNLSGAFRKLTNDALLSSDDRYTAETILEALEGLETRLNQAYEKVKPKD